MGLKTSKPTKKSNTTNNNIELKKNMNTIQNQGHSKTKLKEDDLKLVKKQFLESSGGDRVINFQEFVNLFGLLNPHCTGPHLISHAERQFMISDTNYDGYLT